ncbi:MAG: 16S rRNA (cytosine1402-N4)-methyltransferase [Sphingobacteriales bacterium]|jgi:16S rRNA (cytosine1402-N4)-methyltransferase
MNNDYHIPVLAKECIEGLVVNDGGIYCDLTFGGGGHSKLILDALSDSGKLFAFDQDKDAAKNAFDDPRFQFVPQNFRYVQKCLRLYGITHVDGIMADFGVSSFQFDEAERGFSIRQDGPLDMRMNQAQKISALDILKTYSNDALADVLYKYGELHNSRKISNHIKANLMHITSTGTLVKVIEPLFPPKKMNQFLARVFQALRIEVNAELDVLKSMLEQTKDMLKPGGRLVMMSYHSLEDRLVKNFLKSGNFEGKIEKDFYGQHQVDFKLITRKPLIPSDKEQAENTRSRSAKLRIAERL